MVNNIRFDRLKKEIDGEVWGVILVTFSNNSITKVISTGKKIKRVHFDGYFNKDFKRFAPTTVIDSASINNEITNIINTRNPFTPKRVTGGYVEFMLNDISFVANLSTRTTYTYIAQSFKDYLITIDKTDIPLTDLSFEVFRHYKQYLDSKLSFGTIKYYFNLHRAFVAKAFDENKTDFVLSLKRFQLENNGRKPTVLSDNDIDKLRSVPSTHPLSKFVQFSLMQLFCNGIRFSDCLLIKLSDFKPTYLEIHQMKTNRVLQVLYSPMIIDTMYSIFKFDYVPHVHPYNHYVNELIKDVDSEFINTPKQEQILSFISEQPNRLLFDFVDPILFNYVKGTDMTPEQHKRYILHRVNHNNYLGRLIKPLKLSVDTLTSHSMRYAYTRIALENEIPLRILSLSLGHSSVVITEQYVRNNFQVDKYKIIGEMWTSKYKSKEI